MGKSAITHQTSVLLVFIVNQTLFVSCFKSPELWARSMVRSDSNQISTDQINPLITLSNSYSRSMKTTESYAHRSTMIERVLIWPVQKDPERKLLLSTYQIFAMDLDGSQDDFRKCPHDSGKHANMPSVVAPKAGALLQNLNKHSILPLIRKNPRIYERLELATLQSGWPTRNTSAGKPSRPQFLFCLEKKSTRVRML